MSKNEDIVREVARDIVKMILGHLEVYPKKQVLCGAFLAVLSLAAGGQLDGEYPIDNTEE